MDLFQILKKGESKSGVDFGRFEIPESFQNRFKTILLDQEMRFKKNPIKKNIFFGSKKDFQKKVWKKMWFSPEIPKFDFFLEKVEFFEKSRISIFEIFLSDEKNILFSDFFFQTDFFPKQKNVFFQFFF